MKAGGQRQTPADVPLGKRPGTHRAGGGWASGPFWTGAENVAYYRDPIPGRPSP